jgi:DNA repair photolyase
MSNEDEFIKGRGAQYNADNAFLKNSYDYKSLDGIDEFKNLDNHTTYFYENPKKIVNTVTSPDLGMEYSMNPYQGCEHGCIYCYARNSHQYWGYSAGIDFESKIIIKKNAPELLENLFNNKTWKAHPIVLSGNTDCYQPIEKKLKITRKILEVFLKYRHPVQIITKNSLILRDLDILSELNKMKLVQVNISVTSVDEKLRLLLEPRTTTCAQRIKSIEMLSKEGIPVNTMIGPVIPGLNDHEIPKILKATSEAGARTANYIMIRLNGSVKEIFTDWIQKAMPDKATKVLHQIANCHAGQLNDSRYGVRLRGEGPMADMIEKLFDTAYKKYYKSPEPILLDNTKFLGPSNAQLNLF